MGCGSSNATDTTARPVGTQRRVNQNQQNQQNQQHQQHQQHQQNQSKPSRRKKDIIIEKGYKKRIRENLRNVTAGNDVDALYKSMEIFVNNHMEDGGDYEDASRRLEFLLIRKEIRDACMRRHPEVLDKAIQRVEASPYKRQLKPYLDRACYIKQHQAELDTFRHDISDMEQSTVSEIRSYHNPPPGVHETMIATYLCLGYPEHHLIDWTELTALMGRIGKDSLIREVSQADTRKIDNTTALRSRNYLGQYTLEEVRSVSTGAAAFYVWASRMVGKYDSRPQKGIDVAPKKLQNSGLKGNQTSSQPGNQQPTPNKSTKLDVGKERKQEKQQQNQTAKQQQTSVTRPDNPRDNKHTNSAPQQGKQNTVFKQNPKVQHGPKSTEINPTQKQNTKVYKESQK